MNLRDALALKHFKVVVDGTDVTLRRPSVADLASAATLGSDINIPAWLVFNHLLADNGTQYFSSIEEVLSCDGKFVELIADQCEKLYGEGRDSTAQH